MKEENLKWSQESDNQEILHYFVEAASSGYVGQLPG